jgi:nucleoside-diphosphate-sugar epimerase
MRHVMVVGGAGYKGCVLVPKLLKQGYKVTVYDVMYFGSDGLPKNEANLNIIEGDVRDLDLYKKSLEGVDTIIHLACLSNDPSFELEPGISKEINFDSFEPLVKATKEAGIDRFIYVSTSSVYGVSDALNITEEHPLVPLTDYNKYKGLTEPVLLKYQDDSFTTVIIRPATVCGYSPRTRLDLSVNILTNHAYHNGKIMVFGGEQKRPNIHVEDITDLYTELVETPKEKIAGEIFNCGYQNYKIIEIANFVKEVVEAKFPEKAPIEIEVTSSDDIRSYHISSEKIERVLGFKPKRNIADAVSSLCDAFIKGDLENSFDDPKYFNIRIMKELDNHV